jgi:kynurenine formamidase
MSLRNRNDPRGTLPAAASSRLRNGRPFRRNARSTRRRTSVQRDADRFDVNAERFSSSESTHVDARRHRVHDRSHINIHDNRDVVH